MGDYPGLPDRKLGFPASSAPRCLIDFRSFKRFFQGPYGYDF